MNSDEYYEILDFLSKEQVDRLRGMGVLNETRLRDERIRMEFKQLREQGLPSSVSIKALMGKFYRSSKTIERVVYGYNLS